MYPSEEASDGSLPGFAAYGDLMACVLGIFVLFIILFTATQRAVLRPDQGGFFYMRLGMDELKMFALAFGIGWVLAHFVLRPIERIAATARTIEASRDVSRRASSLTGGCGARRSSWSMAQLRPR